MKIVTSLQQLSKDFKQYILTIGNFDGVHLGHQSIIKRVKEIANRNSALTAALTFSNHPANVIYQSPISLLCTMEHKIQLMQNESIDLLILIPFTQVIAEQSASSFLTSIKEAIRFETLILGNDATLGKNKEGDQKVVKLISKQLGFQVEYLNDYSIEGHRISSSKIRECIRQGNFIRAQQMLGRPFSIYAPIAKGAGRGSQIGFPTANIIVDDLCLPPQGVYAVTVKYLANEYFGVANLGMAPTLRNDHKTIFEVHLFNHSSNLYGKNVEVIFNKYLRPEQRFNDVQQLKEQISKDVLLAKRIHGMN